MFAGIVEESGQVVSFAPKAEAWELVVAADQVAADAVAGDSIAVNGCCLTVARRNGRRLEFDVLEETRRLTNFQALQPGELVNLERSLRFDGRVGGHFVTGHIDTTGAVDVFEPRGKDHYLRVRVPAEFDRYIVHKGSIAIDGVSLTVAEVGDGPSTGSANSRSTGSGPSTRRAGSGQTVFAVWLIPHTLGATNLRDCRVGGLVNLEFDLLGKHVEKLLALRSG